ncbi:MAG: peptide deformylase [Planctomycetota bacterium]
MSETEWSSDGGPFELRFYPDPILKRRAKALATIDHSVRDRVARMFEIMYEEGGIGLAAPQVGWSERVFVINLTADPDQPEEELVFINPKVTQPSGTDTEEEGCLSFPDLRIPVARPAEVRVKATALDGSVFELETDDLLARCVQHELDHLDGVLFVDRAGFAAKTKAKKALKELERDYRDAKRGD